MIKLKNLEKEKYDIVLEKFEKRNLKNFFDIPVELKDIYQAENGDIVYLNKWSVKIGDSGESIGHNEVNEVYNEQYVVMITKFHLDLELEIESIREE